MKCSAVRFAVVLLMLLTGFAGCATAPTRQNLPGISSDVRQGAAVVVCQTLGAKSFAKSLFAEFTNDKGADLRNVNGQHIEESAVTKLGREYWLKPGTYGLTVACYIRQGGAESLRNIDLEPTLEANHVYRLKVGYTQIRGGMSPEIECNASLRDNTHEAAQAVQRHM